MADVNQAYINNLYYEPGTGGVGVITLTISYRDTEAQAIILVPPPTDYSIRDQIFSLGNALQRAARSPQPLFSYPRTLRSCRPSGWKQSPSPLQRFPTP
jgi:hypothetical protein